jgi:diguanylate cyclase (GGDEF)-like protein
MKDVVVQVKSAVTLSQESLDRLMPMYISLDIKGNVTGCGPTLARVFVEYGLKSAKFFELFTVRRPNGITTVRKLGSIVGERVQVVLKNEACNFSLRGLCLSVASGQGYLLNLSFGIGVVDAVRDLQLSEADFAPTDLAIEMLYLVEAKSAVMRELRDLNVRLQGAKQEAEHQALTDTLTGLRNRRALESEMARLLKRGTPFALMHMDLDYFKAVNDTLGHAAGDFVLRQVAEILTQETRASDTIARVGGDEFVLVFHTLEDHRLLMAIGERIIAALSAEMDFEGTPCKISASMGITQTAFYEQPEIDIMHADADAALYESKNAGRGRGTMFASPAAALEHSV